jgi:hypothetical protein
VTGVKVVEMGKDTKQLKTVMIVARTPVRTRGGILAKQAQRVPVKVFENVPVENVVEMLRNAVPPRPSRRSRRVQAQAAPPPAAQPAPQPAPPPAPRIEELTSAVQPPETAARRRSRRRRVAQPA